MGGSMMDVFAIKIAKVCKAKPSATATGDSHYCTCLGHLGQCDKK